MVFGRVSFYATGSDLRYVSAENGSRDIRDQGVRVWQ